MYLCEIIQRGKFLLERGAHKRDALLIVNEGNFEFEICGKKYTARKNDIAFFKKNTEFTRRVLAPIKCLYIQSNGALNQIPGLLRCDDDARKNNTVIHLTSAIRAGDELLINHYISDILISVKNGHPAQDRRMLALTDYIDKNYTKIVSIESVCEHLNINKFYLTHIFKEQIDMPPIKYLIYKRMEHAKQLLISDNGMSINEIAEECGYSDTAYFCRVFKKTVDITPLQYKIKHLRRNKKPTRK